VVRPTSNGSARRLGIRRKVHASIRCRLMSERSIGSSCFGSGLGFLAGRRVRGSRRRGLPTSTHVSRETHTRHAKSHESERIVLVFTNFRPSELVHTRSDNLRLSEVRDQYLASDNEFGAVMSKRTTVDLVKSTNEHAALGFVDVRAAAERAAALVEQGTSTNTRRSYATSWAQWESFVRANGREPLECTQEEAVSLLLVWIGALRNEGLSVATIKTRMAGVAAGYSDAGIDVHPTDDRRVRLARRGLARDAAEKGERRKQAKGLSVEHLRQIIPTIPSDTRGLRDRAFLLLAFSGMLRLDDLCALRREQVEFRDAGLVLHVGRSKTDQTGKGAKVPVRAGKGHLCPVAAVRAWFDALDNAADPKLHATHACIDASGPIFRAVNRHGGIGSSALTVRAAFEIFRSRGDAAGVVGLSGHSARVGAIKEASLVGASVAEIASVSRHKTASVVLTYIDDVHLFSGKDVFRGALTDAA
jgi:integrase